MSSSTRTFDAVLETLSLPNLRIPLLSEPLPTPPEYVDCLGTELPTNSSLDLKGRRRWIAVGRVAAVWQDMQDSIDSTINQNHGTIFQGLSILPTISRCCWMIGTAVELAQPTAVITSPRQRVLKRIASCIKKNGILKGAKFAMLTIRSTSDVYYETLEVSIPGSANPAERLGSLCGAQVYSNDFGRLATLGGVIMLDGNRYGLTVAHVCVGEPFPQSQEILPPKLQFYHQHDSISSSDEESDDSMTSVSVVEDFSQIRSQGSLQESDTLPNIKLSRGVYSHETRHHPDMRWPTEVAIESVSSTHPLRALAYEAYDRNDWALLELPNGHSGVNAIQRSTERGPIPVFIGDCEDMMKDGTQLCVLTRRGVLEAYSISGAATSINFFGSKVSQLVWSIQLSKPLDYGDSGSWVIDAKTGNLYGVLVSGSNLMLEGYIIPAVRIFENIRRIRDVASVRLPVLEGSLVHASRQGHQVLTQVLLQKGANINAMESNFYNLTALRAAVYGSHHEIVKILLDNGAHVNTTGPDGSDLTVLQIAATWGYIEIVKMLLENGADVNMIATTYYGDQTALQAAAQEGHLEIVKLLLENGADISAEAPKSGKTALQAAANNGQFEIVKLLLEKGADINAAAALSSGMTALQAAVQKGHLKIVNLLLEKGADVSAKAAPISGMTAIQAAAQSGHLEIVKLLLENRADVNAKASLRYGMTALQAAADSGQLEIVKVLLVNGANVEAEATHYLGRTALHAAIQRGNIQIVRLLLEKGTDVNGKEDLSYGMTALQAAVNSGQVEIVKLLVENGANINAAAVPYSGRTALQVAAQKGHLEIVKLLLDKGADVNGAAALYSGMTALQAAANNGQLEIVKILLENGADINAAASRYSGRTALDAAARGRHVEIAKILLENGADVNVGYYSETSIHALLDIGQDEIVRMRRQRTAADAKDRLSGQAIFGEAKYEEHAKKR